jgi:hypothetical protein
MDGWMDGWIGGGMTGKGRVGVAEGHEWEYARRGSDSTWSVPSVRGKGRVGVCREGMMVGRTGRPGAEPVMDDRECRRYMWDDRAAET